MSLMLSVIVPLVLAACQAQPTKTPAVKPSPRVVRAETPSPAGDSLAGLASRVKLKATPGTPIAITDRMEEGQHGPTRTVVAGTRPEYIKNLVAYREGDGIVVYFTLANAEGTFVAATGRASLKIVANGRYESKTIFWESFPIKAEDFSLTAIGAGAFEHDKLIYRFKRLKFQDMLEEPLGADRFTVFLDFEFPGQKTLTNAETFYP